MEPYGAPAADRPDSDSAASSVHRRRVGLGDVIGGVLLRPRRFFAALSDSDVRVREVPFYAVLVMLQVVGVVGAATAERGGGLVVSAIVGVTIGLAFGALWSVPQLYLTAAVVHLVARGLGGRGPVAATRRALAFASVPAIFAGVPVVGFLAILWSSILQILAVSAVHRIGRTRATVAFASPIVAAVGVALMLRSFFLEAFKMPSASMVPTLLVGDHLFATKAGTWLGISTPRRGDVLVFRYPDPDPSNPPEDYLKRVIALPDDVLELDHGHPILNGWRVPSCHVGTTPFYDSDPHPSPTGETGELFVEFLEGSAYLVIVRSDSPRDHDGPYTVPAGQFYVLGDNRDNSADSRTWNQGRGGGVPFANIRGHARWLWLPFSRFGISLTGAAPVLPDPTDRALAAALAKCLAHAPPADRSTPPPPATPVPRP